MGPPHAPRLVFPSLSQLLLYEHTNTLGPPPSSLTGSPATLSYCPVDPSAHIARYCACSATKPTHAATTPRKKGAERALESTHPPQEI
jgi:hypothetical protein